MKNPSVVASLLTAFLSMTMTLTPVAAQDDVDTVLITGSSKGHGLAFVKDYAARGWTVIATCRSPETSSRLTAFAAEHGSVVVDELDLTDYAEMDDAWFEEIMRVNVIGQLYTAEAFLEHVAASRQKKIVAMSAAGGSIGNVRSAIAPSYRSSKSALNMLFRTYGEVVKDRGVAVLVLAPGTVDAEDYMNAEDPSVIPAQFKRMIEVGVLEPQSTIGVMIDFINRLAIEDIGQFHKFDGTTLPW